MVEDVKFRRADVFDFIEFKCVYSKTKYLGDKFSKVGDLNCTDFMRWLEKDRLRLCVVNGKIVGYAIIEIDKSDDVLSINQIFIESDYQGRGLGRRFTRSIEMLGRYWGCRYVELTSANWITNKLWANLGYSRQNDDMIYRKVI